MYICVCNAVTDSAIRDAVENGVKTMRELRMATGCAGSCGRCAEVARDILDENTQVDQSPFSLQIVRSAA